MDARDTAILMEDISQIYEQHDIYQEDINSFGNPVELGQAWLSYFGIDSTRQTTICPTWSRDNGYKLRIDFEIKSYTGKHEPYKVPAVYRFIDYSEDPLLIDFARRPRCKTRQDDMLWLAGKKEPSHQEILVRLWSENLMEKYTEKRKKMNKLKRVYRMARKYTEKNTPWYISDTFPEELSIEFQEAEELKNKGKMKAREFVRRVCGAFEEAYR